MGNLEKKTNGDSERDSGLNAESANGVGGDGGGGSGVGVNGERGISVSREASSRAGFFCEVEELKDEIRDARSLGMTAENEIVLKAELMLVKYLGSARERQKHLQTMDSLRSQQRQQQQQQQQTGHIYALEEEDDEWEGNGRNRPMIRAPSLQDLEAVEGAGYECTKTDIIVRDADIKVVPLHPFMAGSSSVAQESRDRQASRKK